MYWVRRNSCVAGYFCSSSVEKKLFFCEFVRVYKKALVLQLFKKKNNESRLNIGDNLKMQNRLKQSLRGQVISLKVSFLALNRSNDGFNEFSSTYRLRAFLKWL